MSDIINVTVVSLADIREDPDLQMREAGVDPNCRLYPEDLVGTMCEPDHYRCARCGTRWEA